MLLSDYWNLLSTNKFKIHPTRYPMTALVGATATANSCLRPLQEILYSKRVENTPLTAPPVFIIGHWRSGTTLLHELMSLDEQFCYPTTYDAFVPHHFLVTGWIGEPFINLLMPKKRPMDNMPVKSGLPQEDEFGLLSLGGPTAYRRFAFPNNDTDYARYLDGDLLTNSELSETKEKMVGFLQSLNYKYKKRMLLKSPPHTGRVQLLREWFPGAKFIHIARHPYRLVPSTLKLWQTLDVIQSFQIAKYDCGQLLAFVNKCQKTMYGAFDRDAAELEENEIAFVKFEDLIADPVREIFQIYNKLELPGLNAAATKIDQNFRSRKHKKNEFELHPAIGQEINTHWSDYMQRYGYDPGV